MLLLKLNIGCERFYLCRLFTIDIGLNRRSSPGNITHAQKLQTLYFLVDVVCEARIDKIAKNIEFLILKEI